MNHQRRSVLAYALATIGAGSGMSGCAVGTGPAFDASALPPIAAGRSRVIVFYRSAVWEAPNFWRRVEMDGRAYGDIGKGEFIVLDAPPGRRQINLMTRSAWHADGGARVYHALCEVPVGQTAYLMFIGDITRGPTYGQPSPAIQQFPESLALGHLKGMTQAALGTWHDGKTGKPTAIDTGPPVQSAASFDIPFSPTPPVRASSGAR